MILGFIPLWVVFGLAAAILGATWLLIQEHFKAPGFAMAYWNKIVTALVTMPFALFMGFPQDPLFYLFLTMNASLWLISDIILFGNVAKHGAGVISRLLPLAVLASFVLWFFFDPALLQQYLSTPVRSALIVIVLCATVFFTTRLKKCEVSWSALRSVWFVIFAAIIGPILIKTITQHTGMKPLEGAFSYVFCEAVFMLFMWSIYYAIRHPVPFAAMISRQTIKAGLSIGAICGFSVVLGIAGYSYVDNPAFMPAIKYLDSVFILMFYKITGRKETADVKTGLAVVVCAALLIILKSGNWNF
ncbi:MAG: hypothetical protein GC136_02760 [Alphaproteobacteria bacterium]|nr:hypothetical protein [Alphaproteobacteria bacterium]